MLQEAISKLKTEMEANRSNQYIQYIGKFLLGHIEKNSQDAEKILTANKTIGKSLDAMRTVAQTKKIGNVAMLTPDEGFKVVLEYFGINSDTLTVPTEASSPAAKPKPLSDFDVKLDDFI
jgi:hypothetical protein